MRTAEIRVGEGTQSFAVELWSTLPNIVMVSVTSPSGERTGMIPIRLGYLFDFSFLRQLMTLLLKLFPLLLLQVDLNHVTFLLLLLSL